MKKLVILVLLVPILALTMISCDADMRSNIAGFMGGFGGNVYADAGLIVVNTAQAEAAAATVAAIGTGADGSEDISDGTSISLGISVTVPEGVTKILAPQSKAKQDELNNNLADALNGKQKEQLLKDLGTKVTDTEQKDAAKGTAKVFNETLKELGTQLSGNTDLGNALKKLELPDLGSGDDLTQGDLLTLQLMTNLISNTVKKLNDLSSDDLSTIDGDTLKDNPDDILAIVGEALFVADVLEQISGADSLNIFAQINFQSVIDEIENKGMQSRDIPLSDAKAFLDVINPIAPSIVSMMGVTKSGNVYTYSPDKYASFLLNQWAYRSTIEQALTLIDIGELSDNANPPELGSSVIIKYALAVFITEHDDYWKDWKKSNSSATITPNAIIVQYLNSNKNLASGDLSEEDKLVEPSFTDAFSYDDWPKFMTTSLERVNGTDKGKAYYKAILENIIVINTAGGFDILREPMDNFLNGTGDFAGEGFDTIYQDLIDEIDD